MNQLEDEIDFIQFGQVDEVEFTDINFSSAESSRFNKWPTYDQPDNQYKVIGIWLTFGQSVRVTERQTYDFLVWLGDIGGLNQGLLLIAHLLVSPVSTFALRLQLMSLAKSQKSIEGADSNTIKFKMLSFFCNWRQQRQERLWLEKLHRQVLKELDLIKILKRQRALVTAVFALLNEAQLNKLAIEEFDKAENSTQTRSAVIGNIFHLRHMKQSKDKKWVKQEIEKLKSQELLYQDMSGSVHKNN